MSDEELRALDEEYGRLVRVNLLEAVRNRVARARLLLEMGRQAEVPGALVTLSGLSYYGNDPAAQALRHEAASLLQRARRAS